MSVQTKKRPRSTSGPFRLLAHEIVLLLPEPYLAPTIVTKRVLLRPYRLTTVYETVVLMPLAPRVTPELRRLLDAPAASIYVHTGWVEVETCALLNALGRAVSLHHLITALGNLDVAEIGAKIGAKIVDVVHGLDRDEAVTPAAAQLVVWDIGRMMVPYDNKVHMPRAPLLRLDDRDIFRMAPYALEPLPKVAKVTIQALYVRHVVGVCKRNPADSTRVLAVRIDQCPYSGEGLSKLLSVVRTFGAGNLCVLVYLARLGVHPMPGVYLYRMTFPIAVDYSRDFYDVTHDYNFRTDMIVTHEKPLDRLAQARDPAHSIRRHLRDPLGEELDGIMYVYNQVKWGAHFQPSIPSEPIIFTLLTLAQ